MENRSIWHFLGGGPGSIGVNVRTGPLIYVGRLQQERGAGTLLRHDTTEHVGSTELKLKVNSILSLVLSPF